MFLDDQAEVCQDGIHFCGDTLRQVGIAPEASCWGVWLRDWPRQSGPRRGQSKPSHFAISPFHPNVWPALLRFTLKLDDKDGVISRATDVLADQGINILSHHFCPTGHNHGTLDLVGSVPRLLSNRFLEEMRARPVEARRADDIDLKELITKEWGDEVLATIESLEAAILAAHVRTSFLRDRFLPYHQSENRVCGLGYDPCASTHKYAYTQFIHAISIRWLQYPAFYWFHGEPTSAIELLSDYSQTSLIVQGAGLPVFQRQLPDVVIRDKEIASAIVSVEHGAHIARVMPMRLSDGVPLRVTIQHEYSRPSAEPDPGTEPRSIGLLRALTKAVRDADGSIWYMSNQIHGLGGNSDRTDVTFVVTDGKEQGMRNPPLKLRLEQALEPNAVKLLPSGVKLSMPHIVPFGPSRVFVSKSWKWWTDKARGLPVQKCIRQQLEVCGYTLEEDPAVRGDSRNEIRERIVAKIQSSQGFLLIIDRQYVQSAQGLQWLLLELGVAIGANVPYVVLVEKTTDEAYIKKYLDALRTLYDIELMPFASDAPKDFIDRAIQKLDRLIRRSGGR